MIAVWTILKAQMMPDESSAIAEAQAEAAERYARSAAQFERDHNCSMGDYMRGSVLHVDGMLSQANILSPEPNQKRPHFLSVDVLIRDVEEGTMVLYPVGTPVNFGSLHIYYPGDEQAVQELLSESYGPVGALGANDTGNGTQVQFENPDDVATNFDVESIEGHLVPEQQAPAQPGLLGQGPLALVQGPQGSAMYSPGQQSFGQDPNAAYGQNFPNPSYPGGPPGLYPNQGQMRGGAPVPLSLGDMGIPPFPGQHNQVNYGSAYHPGMVGQLPYGAPLGPGPQGLSAQGLPAQGLSNQGNSQNDQNLVLERKPDGGYSLKFKKQVEEALRTAQNLGGPVGPNSPGQGYQFEAQRRFGSPQVSESAAGRSRLPFGSQVQGPISSSGQQEQSRSTQSRLSQLLSGIAGQFARPPSSGEPASAAQQIADSSSSSTSQGLLDRNVKPQAADVSANVSVTNFKPATTIEEPATETPGNEEEKPVNEYSPTDTKEEVNKYQSTESPSEKEAPDIDNDSTKSASGGTLVDKTLFADGFEERLKKYKIELFGKETEEKGDDGSLTGTYRMNNPEICKKFESLDILYLIASKPQSMDVRDRIRQGYVDQGLFENVKMTHVFLVGMTNSPNFQKNLDTEKESYNDIAMGEYMDAPENATLKALSGFRWARQYCKQAKHIFYVDESFFVDTDKLAHGLIPTADRVSEGKYMLCPFMPSFPIPRQGPNAVKKPLFPTSVNFRPYCKSYAVLLSQSAMLSMIEAAEQMAMFPAPDIYLFGYVPYMIGNLELYDVGSKRAFHDFGQEVVSCYEEQKDRCPILASKASSARFDTLFNLMKDRMKTQHAGWDGDNTVWDLKSFKRVV